MEGAQTFPPSEGFYTNVPGSRPALTWVAPTRQAPHSGVNLEAAPVHGPQIWAEHPPALQDNIPVADLSPDDFADYLQRIDEQTPSPLGPYQPPDPSVVLGWNDQGHSRFFDAATGKPLHPQKPAEPAGPSKWQLAMLGSPNRGYSIVVDLDTGSVHPLPPGYPPDSTQPPPQPQ